MLWHKYKNDLSEDYTYQVQLRFSERERAFNDDVYNSAFVDTESHVAYMEVEELSKFAVPETHRNEVNNLFLRETSYGTDSVTRFLEKNFPSFCQTNNLHIKQSLTK